MAGLPLITSPYLRDPARRCECCHWVDMAPSKRFPGTYSVACACPKCLRGQGGAGKVCCCFEREPGTDDDLERMPPLSPY